MTWFLFALFGTVLYVCVAFIDKYLVEVRIPQSGALIVFSGIMNLFVSLFSSIYFHIPYSLGGEYSPLLVSGAFLAVGTAAYFAAIKYINISMVTFLFQLIPVILFITSFFMYGESVTMLQASGTVLLILSIMAITRERMEYGNRSSLIKGMALIGVYDVCWVAGALSIKSIPGIGIPQILIFELLGFGATSLFLLFVNSIRSDFIASLSTIKFDSLAILFVNEGVLFITAKTLMNYAYTIGKAGLVSSIESIQPVVSVFLGYTLSLIAPKIFKEKTEKVLLLKNVIFGLIILVGLRFIL
jgi:drug/metabolite transporter (DMT)-like permease